MCEYQEVGITGGHKHLHSISQVMFLTSKPIIRSKKPESLNYLPIVQIKNVC